MAAQYTKAQLIAQLTERNAEVKALHEKLGRLQLENATLRSQLKATQSEVTKPEAAKPEAAKPEHPGYQEFKAYVAKRQRLMEACSQLARKYATTARIKNDVVELYSQRRSAWLVAPEFR